MGKDMQTSCAGEQLSRRNKQNLQEKRVVRIAEHENVPWRWNQMVQARIYQQQVHVDWNLQHAIPHFQTYPCSCEIDRKPYACHH